MKGQLHDQLRMIFLYVLIVTGAVADTRTVCYDHVGCFSNSPPFNNADGEIPISPLDMNTTFILYTRGNLHNGDWLNYTNSATLFQSHFNPEYPVKFVVHGFAVSRATFNWFEPMKNELLMKDPLNVVQVAWGNGAKIPYYNKAVANTRLVGQQIFLLTKQMLSQGLPLSNVHVIGHSLGAHIAGYVGEAFKGQLGRISALDPAGPAFENQDTDVRLDPTDALFVDVIHSNGAPFYRGGAGTTKPVGHVDFYPNGGNVQAGCEKFIPGTFSELIRGKMKGAFHVLACSHERSHEFFTESINSKCPFKAYPCNSKDDFTSGKCFSCGSTGCNQLGYNAAHDKAAGTKYLSTLSDAPYCGYHYKIYLSMKPGAPEARGRVTAILYGTTKTTEQLEINGKYDKLPGGVSKTIVVISSVYIDEVEKVEIRYEKYKGGSFLGWGKGDSTLGVSKIRITVGLIITERSFDFCPTTPSILDGQTEILTSTEHTCI